MESPLSAPPPAPHPGPQRVNKPHKAEGHHFPCAPVAASEKTRNWLFCYTTASVISWCLHGAWNGPPESPACTGPLREKDEESFSLSHRPVLSHSPGSPVTPELEVRTPRRPENLKSLCLSPGTISLSPQARQNPAIT